MPDITQYPFDPQGRVEGNYIKGERHVITPTNGYDFHYFVPSFAPFHQKDFKLYTQSNLGVKTYLVEGVDYVLGFRFFQATIRTGAPVYGSISFINRKFAGTVYIDYRTVGGTWNLTQEKILNILADWDRNPVTTTWEQVANIPHQFPPVEHYHHIDDVTGMSDIYAILQRIMNHMFNNSQEGFASHTGNTENPHRVTKDQVGLGRLRDLAILPTGQGANRTDNFYMTPRATFEIIQNSALAALESHRAERNPHNLRASDINVYTKPEITNLLNGKLGTTATAANATRAFGKTEEELKRDILTGTAADSVLFNGTSYTAMVQDVIRRVNAQDPGSGRLSQGDLENLVRTFTAANSVLFNGKTEDAFAQWMIENKTFNAATLQNQTVDQIVTKARQGLSSNASQLEGRNTAQLAQYLIAHFQFPASNLQGKSLQALMGDVANATVANANKAYNKTETQLFDAFVAKGVNASRLNSKDAATIIREAKQNVDAVTLGGKNLNAVRDYVLGSNNINASKLNNKTYDVIMSEVDAKIRAATPTNVNAAQLQGKTVTAILADALNHVNGKVNAATLQGANKQAIIDEARRGTAANASKLNNKSEGQLISEIEERQPYWFAGHAPSEARPRWVVLADILFHGTTQPATYILKIAGATRVDSAGYNNPMVHDTLTLTVYFPDTVNMGGTVTRVPRIVATIDSPTVGTTPLSTIEERYGKLFWYKRHTVGSKQYGRLMYYDKGTFHGGGIFILDDANQQVSLPRTTEEGPFPLDENMEVNTYDQRTTAVRVRFELKNPSDIPENLRGELAAIKRDKADSSAVVKKTDVENNVNNIRNNNEKVIQVKVLYDILHRSGIIDDYKPSTMAYSGFGNYAGFGYIGRDAGNLWGTASARGEMSPYIRVPYNRNHSDKKVLLIAGDGNTGNLHYRFIGESSVTSQKNNKWNQIATTENIDALKNTYFTGSKIKIDAMQVNFGGEGELLRKYNNTLEAGILRHYEDIFVDAVNGHDDTGDGSKTKPYRTVEHAIKHMRPFAYTNAINLMENQEHILGYPRAANLALYFTTKIRVYNASGTNGTRRATLHFKGINSYKAGDTTIYQRYFFKSLGPLYFENLNIKQTFPVPNDAKFNRAINGVGINRHSVFHGDITFNNCKFEMGDKVKTSKGEIVLPLVVSHDYANTKVYFSGNSINENDFCTGTNPIVWSGSYDTMTVNLATGSQSAFDKQMPKILHNTTRDYSGRYKYYNVNEPTPPKPVDQNAPKVKDIKVISGIINVGEQIPIPEGFNESECTFFATPAFIGNMPAFYGDPSNYSRTGYICIVRDRRVILFPMGLGFQYAANREQTLQQYINDSLQLFDRFNNQASTSNINPNDWQRYVPRRTGHYTYNEADFELRSSRASYIVIAVKKTA